MKEFPGRAWKGPEQVPGGSRRPSRSRSRSNSKGSRRVIVVVSSRDGSE